MAVDATAATESASPRNLRFTFVFSLPSPSGEESVFGERKHVGQRDANLLPSCCGRVHLL